MHPRGDGGRGWGRSIRAGTYASARGHMHLRGDICIREGTYASARGRMHPRGDVCIRVGTFGFPRSSLLWPGFFRPIGAYGRGKVNVPEAKSGKSGNITPRSGNITPQPRNPYASPTQNNTERKLHEIYRSTRRRHGRSQHPGIKWDDTTGICQHT